MSPPSVTAVACGAKIRNVTRPSLVICGDTTGAGPRRAGGAPEFGAAAGTGACAKTKLPAVRQAEAMNIRRKQFMKGSWTLPIETEKVGLRCQRIVAGQFCYPCSLF